MECLNCGAPVLETGHCSTCGMNNHLLAKAYNTSDFYYNIGLDKASVRDLTGAIDALELSLKYNKQNINARNLLGLIHYEMGEIVLGLTQWVISSNYLPEHNMAVGYIQQVQSDSQKLNEANQLAKQFNQSLGYAKSGMKDLAFLQLKRILSSYPHFVKGYLLLALLYIDAGNYDKAKKALKRVLRIDKNNTLAIKYLKEMGLSSKDIIAIKEDSSHIKIDEAYQDDADFKTELETLVEKTLENAENSEGERSSFKEINHNKFNLLYVSVGLIIGMLAFWLLILPTKLSSANKENRQLQIQYGEQISEKNVDISNLEKQIKDLEQQVAVAEKEKEQNIEREEDADTAFEIIKDNIPKMTYENLCAEATKAMNERDYAKAIAICNAALQIQQGDLAYYYLGKAYIGNQEEEKAKAAFISIRDNYPESAYIEEVNEYLLE